VVQLNFLDSVEKISASANSSAARIIRKCSAAVTSSVARGEPSRQALDGVLSVRRPLPPRTPHALALPTLQYSITSFAVDRVAAAGERCR